MDSDSSVSVATPRGLVTITAPRLASRRLRTRQEAHRDFLASHWAELSAAAYEGYRRHGAGAVVLWRSERPRWFRPRPFEPERLFYTTQIHALPGTTEADFDALMAEMGTLQEEIDAANGWEARQLETYDPEAEGLVVFVEGDGVAGYRVAGQPSPPEAHRASRAREN